MRVYVVMSEDRDESDGERCTMIREVYGIYLLESFAEAAVIEAKAQHDYAFVEQHFVE